MLKNRLISVLVVKGGVVVQSLGFNRYLPVGAPSIQVEYLDRWGIDEIVLLDIDATLEGRGPRIEILADCAHYCQVPLSMGGGVRDLFHMERMIRSGADKVVINTAAAERPALIREGARRFGSQCMVVSIDARLKEPNRYEAFTRSGTQPTGLSPQVLAQQAEEYGAGEILINSIDQDGSKKGYDQDLVEAMVQAVKIPVIACGGAGHPSHFREALGLGAAAAAAANYFHFTEHSVILAKRYLLEGEGKIRLDTATKYEGFSLDSKGRASKKEDAYLERLRFIHTPEEKI